LEDAQQAVQRLQQLGHILEQTTDYPWWGFKAEQFSMELRNDVVRLLDQVAKQVERVRGPAEQYAARLGANGSVDWWLQMGELLQQSPPVYGPWLTAPDLPDLSRDLQRCAEGFLRQQQDRASLTAQYSEALWRLPEGTAAQAEQVWQASERLLAEGDE